MDTNISSHILSEMFETEISLDYSIEDIENAQFTYLTAGNFSFDKLISYSNKYKDLVVDTLCLLYDSPEMASLEIFPFKKFETFIEEDDLNKIEITRKLSQLRPNFYINLLYMICKGDCNHKNYLNKVQIILRFKGCYKVFENKELWGLGRARIGVISNDDDLVISKCCKGLLDITQFNKIKNLLIKTDHQDSINDDRMPIYPRNCFTLIEIPLISRNQFKLPFFLDDLFNIAEKLINKPNLEKRDLIYYDKIINSLHEIFSQLLLNPTIKENFCNLIENVCAQDRAKMVYKTEENCSDSFCFTLLFLLLSLSKGIFNNSFIQKIGGKKFPTFCFFYISRLMEITTSKLIHLEKETSGEKDFSVLLSFKAKLLLDYIEFVFQVLCERETEALSSLIKYYLDNCVHNESKKIDEGYLGNDRMNGVNIYDKNDVKINTKDSCTIPNKELDGPTCEQITETLKKRVDMMDCIFENKKATAVSEVLYDESFLKSILEYLQLYSYKSKGQFATKFIEHLFLYKNNLKTDALCILISSDAQLREVLIKRIVLLYSSKSDDDPHGNRFQILRILKDCDVDVNNDSLRMISITLGSFEENLSLIFDKIKTLNEDKEKKDRLMKMMENNDQEHELSEDEEKIHLLDSSTIRFFSLRTDKQIEEFLLSMEYKGDIKTEIKNIRTQIMIQNNEYKKQLYKKIKVCENRIKLSGRHIKSSAVYLDRILSFLKAQSKRNKKLFLNKSIFSKLFSILNSAFNLLVGERSKNIKINNKEDYLFDPKEILYKILSIVINILKNNERLTCLSGLNTEMLQSARDLASRKYIINEEAVYDLDRILKNLENFDLNGKKNELSLDELIIDDTPDEFLDPLTYSLMKDPITLTTSKVTIDRSTFNQIMLNDRTDPFSRMPIDETKIVVNSELKERIEEYIKNRKQ